MKEQQGNICAPWIRLVKLFIDKRFRREFYPACPSLPQFDAVSFRLARSTEIV